MSRSPLAYYITAHGYGHGVRSCDILLALHRYRPDIPLLVVTDLPESFLRNRLPDVPLTVRPGSFDVGMVQLDSVRVDVDATRRAVEDWAVQRPARMATERAFLRAQGVRLVVADIPSIPIEAAAEEGVPSVGVGNFTWSWIYSDFAARDARWAPAVAGYEAGYARADLLLRLPFSEPMSVFPVIRDLPLVARPGKSRRAELAALTGAPLDRRWVLLSFTTLDWDEAALREVEACTDYAFFTVCPLGWNRANIFPVDRERMPFSDVIASVDAVLTKPGYGILSECVVNRKPMVYVERTDFIEYPILERALRQVLRHQHIPSADLYAGRLQAALDGVWAAPDPEVHMEAGGDVIAARELAERYDG